MMRRLALAAMVVSRLLRASSGSRYLSETTSPCSVILIVPWRVPNGWASIALPVGPPPRPTVPPLPWNNRRVTPCWVATLQTKTFVASLARRAFRMPSTSRLGRTLVNSEPGPTTTMSASRIARIASG